MFLCCSHTSATITPDFSTPKINFKYSLWPKSTQTYTIYLIVTKSNPFLLLSSTLICCLNIPLHFLVGNVRCQCVHWRTNMIQKINHVNDMLENSPIVSNFRLIQHPVVLFMHSFCSTHLKQIITS